MISLLPLLLLLLLLPTALPFVLPPAQYLPTPTPIFLTCTTDTDSPNDSPSTPSNNSGLRLNKCFKRTHSRRSADLLISSNRVLVNGLPPNGAGHRVQPTDTVTLDNIVYNFNEFNEEFNSDQRQSYLYIKYYKPIGTICTTDTNIKGNVITALQSSNLKIDSRIYPIGRLDKDTTGLILLTNDGRIPNSVLRYSSKKDKVYIVTVNRYIEEEDLIQLSSGVIITTIAQRDNVKKELTAATKECYVERVGSRKFMIVLNEGRNRQIRKMCEALDYRVDALERTEVRSCLGANATMQERHIAVRNSA
ncbi:hypothetical protein TL16_g03207 [Triparma laevis f. inornata]|uniref:RNA-binding S4 domain-containing protein n=1 Tax=Triparma laevis f. inornata TaxID=1714386 RepID=A0A9W6ZVI6_9STRA|nr:hypothetical protein TL16_g03207 [Triparma laevis f. inornata]